MWRALSAGLRRMVSRPRAEQDLSDEMTHYLELAALEHMKRGVPRDEAMRLARAESGGVEAAKELVRASGWEGRVDAFSQDVRHALRGMRRAPAFTAIAIGTLALGIGASTALFSVADEVFLESLPVRNPEELVLFGWHSGPRWIGGTIAGLEGDPISGALSSTAFQVIAFEKFRESTTTLEAVAAFGGNVSVVTRDSSPVVAQIVSGNYFGTLGVRPAIGRMLMPADDASGAPPVAVISHTYWARRFGLDSSVTGRPLTLGATTFSIVGVTAAGFNGVRQLGEAPDVAIPLTYATAIPGLSPKGGLTNPFAWPIRVMGRLKPGVPYEQVQQDLQDELQSAALEGWNQNPRRTVNPSIPQLELSPGGKGMLDARSDLSRVMGILAIVVTFILLIVCTNLANLLLARATVREREIAVRAAMGAGRGRLVRQLLTESALLAFGGAALGAAFAWWGRQLLVVWLDRATPGFLLEPQLDARVLGFTAIVAVLTALGTGLFPALRASRVDLSQAMKEGTPGTGTSRSLASRSLLIVQVALSVSVLVGAGLFLRTVRNLRSTDVGFTTRNVLLFTGTFPRDGGGTADVRGLDVRGANAVVLANWDRIVERLTTIPGVEGVTYSEYPLLSGDRGMPFLYVPGRAHVAGEDPTLYIQGVHDGFFATMQMPVLQGRSLTRQDRESRVVVVSAGLAKHFFPDGALGRRIGITKDHSRPVLPDSELYEIVGVTSDTKFASVRQSAPPTAWRPLASGMRQVTFELRTSHEPLNLIATIRAAARDVSPIVTVGDFRTQEGAAESSFAEERHFATLTSMFGAVALILACLGLYGLVSYRVARRTREMGVRLALGARRGDITRMVIAESVTLAVIGTVIGLAAAGAGARVLRAYLYGLVPIDAVSMGAAALLMIATAIAAAYLPGRRASRIDPALALRHD